MDENLLLNLFPVAEDKQCFPHPNMASCYLEPDPRYPTRSFSEQNPEWFKSASSRNHPRPSEASCLPNQAGFEASCFQHHRQEKRERI